MFEDAEEERCGATWVASRGSQVGDLHETPTQQSRHANRSERNQSYHQRDDESGPDTDGPPMVEEPAGRRRRIAAKSLDRAGHQLDAPRLRSSGLLVGYLARHDYSLLRFLDILLQKLTNFGSVSSVDGDLEFRRPPFAYGCLLEVFGVQLRIQVVTRVPIGHNAGTV